MQNAKDTFYIALRDRLTSVNPGRTMELRSVTRPGIMIEDAESPVPLIPLDAFVLRWTDVEVESHLALPLVQMRCEIHYATAGTQALGGLDRGRLLEEMDAELLQMLALASTRKMNYSTSPATAMQTFVFWDQPEYGPLDTLRDQIGRIVTVTVWSWQEAGEK
ncbi:MAG: hypothetical protein ACP5M4_07850 [Acidobacteriaceae bacterium]